MAILVFDIETVPDVKTGRKLHDLHDLSDKETADAMFALQRAKSGHEFLPHHLQKIVAISAVLEHRDQVQVWSLGDEQSDEAEIITRFYQGLDKLVPTIVSWNGSGFDLPVLHYRALYNKISAPTYWEMGESQQPFKWNNYISRYHYRHLDLMDVMASYNNRAFAPLDQIASMIGFPGKMGMSGAKVWDEFCDGNIKGIRDYCETDVLNTYGVYLRFELMRGHLSPEEFDGKISILKEYLESQSQKQHLASFLAQIE